MALTRSVTLMLFGVLVAAAPEAYPAANLPQPNIVFILSDDHSAQAISCYGSKLAKTPNIDRLAATGIRFDRCFCTESICAPSRAAILTGKYGHITGARGWKPYDRTHRTFPEYLQAGGYQTALFGKYHLGVNPPGFDEYQILPGQGIYHDPKFISKSGEKKYTGHVSDLVTDFALDWLGRRDRAKPFLVCIHHKATHMPWEPAARHTNLFAATQFPEPPTLLDDFAGRTECISASFLKVGYLSRWEPQWGTPPAGDEKEKTRWLYQEYIRRYLQTAAGLDENIGRVLDYLDREKLTQNTVVIYTSDQGFYLGEHGWFDKRWIFEESLRMPLIVRYPKLIKAGTVSEAMALNIDFAPTLLEIAGLPVPADFQGRSLRPLLEGPPPADWRKAIYYRYYPVEYGLAPHLGLRTDRYKLVHYQGAVGIDEGKGGGKTSKTRPVDEWELLDLQSDSQERTNLYGKAEMKNLTADLKAQLEQLRKKLGDKAD